MVRHECVAIIDRLNLSQVFEGANWLGSRGFDVLNYCAGLLLWLMLLDHNLVGLMRVLRGLLHNDLVRLLVGRGCSSLISDRSRLLLVRHRLSHGLLVRTVTCCNDMLLGLLVNLSRCHMRAKSLMLDDLSLTWLLWVMTTEGTYNRLG